MPPTRQISRSSGQQRMRPCLAGPGPVFKLTQAEGFTGEGKRRYPLSFVGFERSAGRRSDNAVNHEVTETAPAQVQ
jgi:hypothetical protein